METSLGKLKFKYSIFCGGLHSDRLAKLDKIFTKSKIVTFRGDFFRLNTNVKNRIKNLVYPVQILNSLFWEYIYKGDGWYY